jgi:hypothetical protein
VVVVRCDALSDNQKWVFDVENDLIRYKADSRYCLRKVLCMARCCRGLTCCACEQVGSGAVAGDSIDLYECDGCTTCGWLLTPQSPTVTQISYASNTSYCIERSVGVLQLQPCNSMVYSDQQWYISSAVSTRQVLELDAGAGCDGVCVLVLCGAVGQGSREHA